jgi:hypothetical protein
MSIIFWRMKSYNSYVCLTRSSNEVFYFFKKIEPIVFCFLFLTKMPIAATTLQAARLKPTDSTGSEQLQQGSLQIVPSQVPHTPQSERKPQSDARVSEEKSKEIIQEFSPREYGPPLSLVDKLYQIPKQELHPSIDYSVRGQKKLWPKKDQVDAPTILRRSPATPAGGRPTQNVPPASGKDAPAKDTAKQAPARDPPAMSPPPKDHPQNTDPPPKSPPAYDARLQRRQQPADNTPPTPVDSTKEYFERMQDESAALDNLRRIQADLSDNIKVLSQELQKEMEAERSEGASEQVAAICQKLNDRLDKYRKQLEEYKATEIRGLRYVSNTREALDKLEGKLDTATKELAKFQNKYQGDDENPQLQDSKATQLAELLRTVTGELTEQSTSLGIAISEHQKKVSIEVGEIKRAVDEVNEQIKAIAGQKYVSKDDIDELTQTIKKYDAGSMELRAEFLRLIQKKIDAATDMKLTDDKLEMLKVDMRDLGKALDEANEALDNIKQTEEELKARPIFDVELAHEILEVVHGLEKRPALNSDFKNLATDVFVLLEMVSKETTDTGNLAAHINGLEAILEKRPGLNINRDELFDRLKRIEQLIHDRPAVNQKEMSERFEKIQAKVDTMDFAGVFNDLNIISADVKAVSNNVNRISDNVNHMSTHVQTAVNRPAGVTLNECREIIQGVHDNIDEVKHNPVLSSNKPLVTQEHFDRTMGPVIVKINDLADTRERGQAILDVVQNVHHGIQESNRRPVFDVRPFNGLSKQLESYHNDGQQNYETIHARLDEIAQDDGSFGNQIKAMRNEFKEALKSNKADHESYQAGLQKKLDVLTGITGGALIVSVLTAGGVLLRKLYGKRKDRGNEKSQAANKKKVVKRLHARSWDDGGNDVYVRSNWDGNILILRDMMNSVQSNEQQFDDSLEMLLKMEGVEKSAES